ncbi:alpha-2-HS-glycoprotein [Anolis carolinensis]|uniref:Alpha 2-HS glycoprotein n=1 Tax=Anolis carolinensis TaxID=28377 RepID=A0A803T2T6_ANOCA|nr:PREDICTED: alpha-2-HS-glycoprotein [Anolis carolinensis]|eukprot:XP_003225747.1 PREDICTED: alpha-2-HS-glycoprotein [Anolis carolinensis]
MKSLIALVLLGQILASKATSEPFPPLVSSLPDCDDPESEAAANFAVDHINSHSLHGYKYTLSRIENVKVLPRRPTGKIYLLELDLAETKCHVLSPTPIQNCSVRAKVEHAVEGDCDVKMLHLDGQYKVLSTKCHSSPDSREDFEKVCPDCAPLALLDDVNVVNAVNTALAQYNTYNSTDHHFELLEIARGRNSHMPPGTFVEFAIAATNCTEQEAKEHKDCHVMTGEHAQFGFCKATIFKKPSGEGPALFAIFPNVVICDIFDKQVGHSHTHLTKHHLGKKIPSPGAGYSVLDLIHSHNNTLASHESHSAEVPVVQASPVVKRAAEVPPVIQPALPHLQQCPGKYRHFDI